MPIRITCIAAHIARSLRVIRIGSKDKVLDLGIGEGAFVFASFRRLLELGSRKIEAQKQIFGAEIDAVTWARFLAASDEQSLQFPNLQNSDFFELEPPSIDVVIGNPPYVRRTYLQNVDNIRQQLLKKNQLLVGVNLNRLTDLYVYFLLYRVSFLKPGGRLAVITADFWLNTRYGQALKEYLTANFTIERLVTLDRRVFIDAQVKPVLLFATKRKMPSAWYIDFIRIKNGLPIETLQQYIDDPSKTHHDIAKLKVKGGDLKPENAWGIHFKAQEMYDELASMELMTPISNLAVTRIGIQTLAKDFFVLTSGQVKEARIEPKFLQPLAQSGKYFRFPTIDANTKAEFYLFYCSMNKNSLADTGALRYIEQAEMVQVQVRGKDTTVTGYQNKERIRDAGRKNWYDLQTDIERRGRAEILIPRLVYRTFTVVWNVAQFVPGELFIEFLPRSAGNIEVYLAILNSSITEIMVRTHAQVYGGGTYNINPGEVKKVPIINGDVLTDVQKRNLRTAYRAYLLDPRHNKDGINQVIYKILAFKKPMQHKLQSVLEDLHLLATSSKLASL